MKLFYNLDLLNVVIRCINIYTLSTKKELGMYNYRSLLEFHFCIEQNDLRIMIIPMIL